MSDYLRDSPVTAKELICTFSRAKGSLRYRAKAPNRLCPARNVATHAGSFEALETMISDAAQLLKNPPSIRNREPAASLVVDGWFDGEGTLYLRCVPQKFNFMLLHPVARLVPVISKAMAME